MTPLSVQRDFAAENLNAVVNHSDVRPWMGGSGYLDLSPVVADLNNVLLMGQGGGLLFQRLADGLYEVHTQFVPDARGANALQAVWDALFWMYTRTDCIEVVTRVPDGNAAALGLVRSIKGSPLFHRPNVWDGPTGRVGVRWYSKTLPEWVRHEDRLEAIGDWFHDKLADAKQRLNGTTAIHDDDDAHDRYVGAAAEMIAAGQIDKGLGFYNRWAVYAGYAPIQLIGLNPPMIDIRDAVLAVRNDDFDVLLVR